MKDWTAAYMGLIEDCDARESRLSDWDAKFLDSIKAQLCDDRSLTDKQIEMLDRIWERVTARG